jgi:hypothetical protein
MESTDQSHPGLDPDRIIPLLVRLRGKGISWLRGGYGESSGDRTVEDINFVDWDGSVHQCMPVKFHFGRRCRCRHMCCYKCGYGRGETGDAERRRVDDHDDSRQQCDFGTLLCCVCPHAPPLP